MNQVNQIYLDSLRSRLEFRVTGMIVNQRGIRPKDIPSLHSVVKINDENEEISH